MLAKAPEFGEIAPTRPIMTQAQNAQMMPASV